MTPHKTPWLASVVASVAAGAGAQVVYGAGPRFRAQEIAGNFGVGYAVASGDVDGDGRTDILAINETDLVWFQAPTWERRVVLTAGATIPDNVTLAPHLGYVNSDIFRHFYGESAKNILAWLDGKPTNVLNPEALSR